MNCFSARLSAPALLLTLGLGAGAALAAPESKEAQRIKALETKLEQSLAVINQLNQRLNELEKRAASSAQAAAPGAIAPTPLPMAAEAASAALAPVAAEARLETIEQGMRDLANANSSRPSDAGVPLHGFLDVGFAKFSKQGDESRSGARVGTFDLYLTPQLGPNVRSLLELAFEYDGSGVLGTDVERLQLGYAFSDDFVLWGGRFHTPYGYWNTAFHHGAQIQTSITRPRFIAFEDQGGILPAHSVGAWGNGKVATDFGKLSYDLYVSNGNRILGGVLDYNASGDDNSSLAYGFNLGLNLKAVPGLTLGLHGMRQNVNGQNADASVTGAARLQFIGGYGFFENDSFEVIGEYYRFDNRNLAASGGSHGSWAAYLQVGYGLMDRLTGFVRYEKAALSTDDPYFTLQQSGSSYKQATLGLRYELTPKAALKLQWDSNQDVANPLGTINTLRGQYAIRF